jgi:hypothetical protein
MFQLACKMALEGRLEAAGSRYGSGRSPPSSSARSRLRLRIRNLIRGSLISGCGFGEQLGGARQAVPPTASRAGTTRSCKSGWGCDARMCGAR